MILAVMNAIYAIAYTEVWKKVEVLTFSDSYITSQNKNCLKNTALGYISWGAYIIVNNVYYLETFQKQELLALF